MKAKTFINALATAGVAIFFTQVLHEATHLVAGLCCGVEVLDFTLFGVDFAADMPDRSSIIINASASIMNLLIALLGIILLSSRKKFSPLWRQFLIQLTGFSALEVFGYFLMDSAFYTPDALGDWKTIINIYGGSPVLRIVLGAIGAAGFVFMFFWLARQIYAFIPDKGDSTARKYAPLRVYLVPYLVFSALYSILAIWSPIGFPDTLIIVFLQYFFGFCGFLWAFFFSAFWLEPPKDEVFQYELDVTPSRAWILTAVILFALQVLLSF